MSEISPQSDFFAKSAESIRAVCAMPDFAKAKTPYARMMNLMMGHPAKTKADSALKDALLADLRRRFPGAAYPSMADQSAGAYHA